MPESRKVRPKASERYWPPRSEWCTSPAFGRRRVVAMPRASITMSALRSSRIDQPQQKREWASITAAGKSQPSQVGT